ncbi:MAG TPA: hypothetical protein VHH36_09700 [Candidatus Thermoplasmatota archaeon]|nr:hypothetical protein [Candidatus Thermoplasmatota archaeon]
MDDSARVDAPESLYPLWTEVRFPPRSDAEAMEKQIQQEQTRGAYQPLLGQGLSYLKPPAPPASLCNAAVTGNAVLVSGQQRAGYVTCLQVEQVKRALWLDGDLSYLGALGLFQNRLSLMREADIRTQDVTILAWASWNDQYNLVNDRPRAGLAGVDANHRVTNWQRFVDTYGTHYTGSLAWGVEYVALFRLWDVQSNSQQNIRNTLDAHGVGPGGGLSGNVAAGIREAAEKYAAGSLSTYRVTGRVATTPPLGNAEKMLAYVNEFPKVPVVTGSVMGFNWRNYRVAGFTGGPS